MSKKKRNSLWCIVLLLFLSPVSYSMADFSAVLHDAYISSQDLSFLPGDKNIIRDTLFSDALSAIAATRIQPAYQAVQSTTQSIQQLGNGACYTVQGNDVIALLYYSYRPFVADVGDVLSDASSVPQISDYHASCAKLIACSQNISIDNYSYLHQEACQNLVVDRYRHYYDAMHNSLNFTQELKGENLLFNGSLDDSPYDLLYDISRIGQILFVGYTPPTTLVYFGPIDPRDIPDVSRVAPPLSDFVPAGAGSIGGSITMANHYTGSTPIQSGISHQSGDLTSGSSVGVLISVSGAHSSTDQQITAFLNYQQSANQSNAIGTILPSNICIAPYASGSVVSGSFLLSGSLHSDLVTTYTTGLQGYFSGLHTSARINQTIPHVVLTGIGNVTDNNSSIALDQQLGSVVNNFLHLSPDPINQEKAEDTVNACLSSCRLLSSFDAVACMAQCLCQQISSQASYIGDYKVIEKDAFVLRFCQVPAQAVSLRKGKTVLSIEDILQEISAVLLSLRQSGQLYKNVKTKEFLDLPSKKNSLADVFSFTINVSSRSPSYQNDNSQLLISQQSVTTDIVAGYTDESLVQQRNKYIVVASPAFERARVGVNATTSLGTLDERASLEDSLFDDVFVADPARTASLITQHINDKTAITLDTMKYFLSANLSFLVDAHKILQDMNQQAADMKTKIQKAP